MSENEERMDAEQDPGIDPAKLLEKRPGRAPKKKSGPARKAAKREQPDADFEARVEALALQKMQEFLENTGLAELASMIKVPPPAMGEAVMPTAAEPDEPEQAGLGERTSRVNESREGDLRAEQTRAAVNSWAPPQALRMPPLPAGFRGRWVREYNHGVYDESNLDNRHAEGYIPVKAEQIPKGYHFRESPDGLVRKGGMILMMIPEDLARQREAYHERRRLEQLNMVNELQGLGSQHRSMPVESRSKSASLEGGQASQFMSQFAP